MFTNLCRWSRAERRPPPRRARDSSAIRSWTPPGGRNSGRRCGCGPPAGWPTAAPQVFAKGLEGAPDGAVTAQDGTVWNAEWGQGRLLAFAATSGALAARFDLPARQLACPAIDPETGCVFVTSAAVGLDDSRPEDGQTFVLDLGLKGVPEPAVRL